MSLSRPLMKKKARITSGEEEDRISRLPDELIHKILSFVDTKLAVQTSGIAMRWKHVWKTLPFLKFIWHQKGTPKSITNFTSNFLKFRNNEAQISNLELAFLSAGLLANFVGYAISHHVQFLNVHLRRDNKPYKLSNFSCNSIQNLQLEMKFEDSISELDCWVLPALKNLHLTSYHNKHVLGKLSELCLTCLPALRTLCLEYFNLQSLTFSLPALATLRLCMCKLPKEIWDFPALKSLTLHDVVFPRNISYMLAALVTLQDLTLVFEVECIRDCVIPCPQLINLEIRNCYRSYSYNILGNIVVVAPNLVNFTAIGIFQIIFGASKLHNVNIKLPGCIIDDMSDSLDELKGYYEQLPIMLPGVASAKILNLELETIEALSSILDFLAIFPSPFYNLKYVKLPHGFDETRITDILKSYLLGGSPTATIVTTLPKNMISYTAAASVTPQNVVLQEPLVSSENITQNLCVDNVDMGVQEDRVEQNSAVISDNNVDMGVQEAPIEQNTAANVEKVKQIGT